MGKFELKFNILIRIIALALFCFSQNLMAQYSERIASPRPGQSFGPNTVGKDIFQLQTGVKYNEGIDKTTGIDFESQALSFLVSLRYGISELIELRSAVQLRNDDITISDVTTSTSGVGLWNAGLRVNLRNGQNFEPSFGFQADARINAVSDDYNPRQIAPRLILLYAQKLTDKLKLISNLGVSWSGNNEIPRGFYTLKFAFPLARNLSAMIENYGDLQSGDFDTRFDSGVTYWLGPNLQLDISSAYGSNEKFREFFVDAGVSWRVHTKNN